MLDATKFEKKVLDGLKSCGIEAAAISEKSPLGIAVSGGADSISLLLSLASIFDSSFLRVITLDHGIRSEEESGGDVDFVRNLCGKLGIRLYIEKIEHGKIEGLAKKSSESVEGLARKLRYEAFESFIQNENLLALCLAHNQNDQCETLLMRFLQGSGCEGMGGIEYVRGKYIRPMLEISRSEIESYLSLKNQSWRTDATNSDTHYLRNRVRNILVPLLDENFPGWQKAVLLGGKKSRADENYFASEIESKKGSLVKSVSEGVEPKSALRGNSSLKIDRRAFYSLEPALQRRIFFDSLNQLGFGSRFPFRVFEKILTWKEEKTQKISFDKVLLSLDSDNLVIEILECEKSLENEGSYIESGFSFILKEAGDSFEIENLLVRAQKSPDSQSILLSVEKNDDGEKISFPVSLPLLVRSPLAGDEIQTSDGKSKLLSDIFTDWKIPKNQRDRILVLENLSSPSKNSLKALLAFHLAFKNWIVE
ncbi:tRNA lysidine(34) synthetase TilS [Treponema ruminis]|uniref:tRNA(Ile)-lysidine synthase n=1 Tax=Treponema ruminis TaxID=744515 RepID=A0A7W8G9L6_9SPIR|nr:tRNA lysidine(34) synthetase TilS [Treponema ruminis]MBB5226365.1 tRNA(Ile)-lysidine synthase [Treponema ruminis]QSI02730.1 tRNA lysidine(34) synthetase TilS [Treponema ruminis]